MKKLIPIILALIILSGCTSAKTTAESEVSKSTTIKAETTTETTTTTPASVETVTEPEMNFVEVSDGNEFIDFDYIKDYKGTTDIGDLAEKAIQALKESDYYTNSMANKENFIGEEFTQYFDENGNIKPIFNKAFVEDFDDDGKTETFLLIDMPYPYDESYGALTRSFMVYISSDERAEVLDSFYCIYEISLLNYGKSKQLIVASGGFCGADAKTLLYGVKNGKSVYLYGFRGDFEKSDCFLSGFGHQCSGDFMYFDTVALEYRIIVGKKLDINEVLSMDKTNSLDDLFLSPIWDKEWSEVYYIGNKYYCFLTGCMTGTIYTYDNGKFILVENSGVRISENFFDMNAVKNIDIDKAVAKMKKPEG